MGPKSFRPSVQLLESPEDDPDTEDPTPRMKVFWVMNTYLSMFDLGLLDRLSSLAVDESIEASKWRKLLENPSQTLKHLQIKMEEPAEPTPLNFPQLEVLDLPLCPQTRSFPMWLIIPSTSLLILSHPYQGLPSISELWVEDLRSWEILAESCPILKTIRIRDRR